MDKDGKDKTRKDKGRKDNERSKNNCRKVKSRNNRVESTDVPFVYFTERSCISRSSSTSSST